MENKVCGALLRVVRVKGWSKWQTLQAVRFKTWCLMKWTKENCKGNWAHGA